MKPTKRTISKQVDTHLQTSKKVFLLGTDKSGVKYWLQEASWDCGWYWGFGYVEQYNYGGKRNPSKCTDIDSHEHIDSNFMGQVGDAYIHNIYGSPKLESVTFSEAEGWVLSELFRTFYNLAEAAAVLGRGGSHTTTNPIADIIKNPDEVTRINTVVLPALFKEIYKILTPKQLVK